ncbi:hypothetical protein SNE40_013168 [Patella caerulea]|uniref:Uncharacterized protein n=1 Tax=Patella caerulea TaxID=87958 RepID=A0AAN8JQX5_PATCE
MDSKGGVADDSMYPGPFCREVEITSEIILAKRLPRLPEIKTGVVLELARFASVNSLSKSCVVDWLLALHTSEENLSLLNENYKEKLRAKIRHVVNSFRRKKKITNISTLESTKFKYPEYPSENTGRVVTENTGFVAAITPQADSIVSSATLMADEWSKYL